MMQKNQNRPVENNDDQMNAWQQRFAHKLEMVRTATRDRFEHAAQQTLSPVFKEFADFTTRHHVRATAPLCKPGIRTYKFTMTENTYLLITFRHVGLQCEAQCECLAPGHNKLPAQTETTDISDMTTAWCRRLFEDALDRLLDTVTDVMGEGVTQELEAVPA